MNASWTTYPKSRRAINRLAKLLAKAIDNVTSPHVSMMIDSHQRAPSRLITMLDGTWNKI